jgi:hypothetical protein
MGRMISCLAVVALGALLRAAPPASLGLVERDGVTLEPPVESVFRHDAERGLRQMLDQPEIIVAWRGPGDALHGESWDRLIVLRFLGDCTARMPRVLPRRQALGFTAVVDGNILPFINVDCDQVKATLMRGDWGAPLVPAGVLGRALSRVALHEIYHVLSGRKHHDAEGSFKAEYSAADLLAPAVLSTRQHAEIADAAGPR